MLSPDEEKELREKARKKLEEEEAERLRQKRLQEQQEQQSQTDKVKDQILLEEREKFYAERGLHEYVNHHGKVEWLTPEEIEAKEKAVVSRSKSRSKRYKHRSRLRRQIIDLVALLGVLLVGLTVPTYIMRSAGRISSAMGSLWICSDVKEAAIFVDEKPSGNMTDQVIGWLKEGEHTVSVAKPGYETIPSEIKVRVVRGRTVKLEFKLKKVE